MDFYLFSLLLGFAGLALLAMAGLHHGHGGQHGHGHGHGHDVGDVGHHGALPHAGHGHAGSLHAGHSHAGHSHAHHGHHHGHGHGHGHDHGAGQAWEIPRRAGGFALSLLSPRGLSSLLLGMGATGLLVDPWLGGPLQAAAALAGALVLELGVIRPMWTLLSGFASPGRTLESALLEEARAVMSFDAQGQGLIAIEMDGQIRQLLGTLRPADRELGLRVRAGDRLLVEEVDAARNRCTVSFLGT